MRSTQALSSEVSRCLADLRFHARHHPAANAGPRVLRENRWRRTWLFPTKAGADRWNAEWEDTLRHPAASHPAIVSIDGKPIADRLLDALARLGGAILSEDMRAGSPYPFMNAGWSYELVVCHKPYASRRANSLIVTMKGQVRGADGAQQWSTLAVRQYTRELIPESIVELWGAYRWLPTVETYV